MTLSVGCIQIIHKEQQRLDSYIQSASEFAKAPAMLIELKYEKDADTAISQIHRQNYPDRLELYKGNLILVGINYDRNVSNDSVEFKHHSCVIERA